MKCEYCGNPIGKLSRETESCVNCGAPCPEEKANSAPGSFAYGYTSPYATIATGYVSTGRLARRPGSYQV